MSAYTDTLAALASSTEGTVTTLYDRWQDGEIVEEAFVVLAAAALLRSVARGTALADVALAGTLSVYRGQPVPTVGLAVQAQYDAAPVRALVASVPDAADLREALAVEARAHSLDGAQKAYGRALRSQGVPGWTRSLSGKACPLCQALAGPVLPASAEMYAHKGCSCSQSPVERSNR